MPADQPAPNQNIPASSIPATPHPDAKNYPKFYLLLGFILIIIAILTGIWIYLAVSKKNNQTIGQNPTNVPAGKCYIDNLPYAPGVANPQNECQVCSPSLDQSPWIIREDNASCGNGMGICKKGQCVPKVQPLSLPKTATDSSGFSSKPPTK